MWSARIPATRNSAALVPASTVNQVAAFWIVKPFSRNIG
jgi:hypothetical protein